MYKYNHKEVKIYSKKYERFLVINPKYYKRNEPKLSKYDKTPHRYLRSSRFMWLSDFVKDWLKFLKETKHISDSEWLNN